MKNFQAVIFVLMLLLTGCNKEKFPDEFVILGSWIEKAGQPPLLEIEFRSRSRAFLTKDEQIDTLMYKIEKRDELQLFLPQDFPEGMHTTHKLGYNSRKEELSIYGLLPSTQETSVNVFVRK